MAIVFLPFAVGYFFSYFFRVVNAVVAPDLIAEIGLNATQPGLLSAVCFFTFAAFQIPLGVVRDNRLCQKRAHVRNRARAHAR